VSPALPRKKPKLLLKRSKARRVTIPRTCWKRLDAEARQATPSDRAKHYITEAIQRSAAEQRD
jgi:hypothetical protein